MKKIGTILLILLYSMSTFGMSVRYHYCMDRLSVIRINIGVHQDCKCSDSVKTEGCCKDKVVYFKGGSHKNLPALLPDPMQSLEIESPAFGQIPLFESSKEVFDSFYEVRQNKFPHPLFLLNRTFRI